MRNLKTDPNAFNVLNHGDFWSSNIMANYLSNGEINELLLLDFQICKWGSPAQDLLFFITISAAKDIRVKEFDHFVEIYHEHLVKCLKNLKYEKPLPKLRDLQMSMYKEENTFYGLLSELIGEFLFFLTAWLHFQLCLPFTTTWLSFCYQQTKRAMSRP